MAVPGISVLPGRAPADGGPLRPRVAVEIDWPRWTRRIDKKRRALGGGGVWPNWVYCQSTRASFVLDGIDLTDADVAAAIAPGRLLRGRPARRVRAHLAILRNLDRCRRRGGRPTPGDVVRWYTRVSDGLSTAAMSPADADRLANVLRRVNSPRRRLRPAVLEAARLHGELLTDPLFPGFNGILSRLLLYAHLAGSGLPPAVPDAAHDARPDPTPAAIALTLLARIDTTLDRLAAADS